MCVVVAGVCHSVPVSEIISVREEEDSIRPKDDDDGSWKKIREGEGKDCRQAFTGKPGQLLEEVVLLHYPTLFKAANTS